LAARAAFDRVSSASARSVRTVHGHSLIRGGALVEEGACGVGTADPQRCAAAREWRRADHTPEEKLSFMLGEAVDAHRGAGRDLRAARHRLAPTDRVQETAASVVPNVPDLVRLATLIPTPPRSDIEPVSRRLALKRSFERSACAARSAAHRASESATPYRDPFEYRKGFVLVRSGGTLKVARQVAQFSAAR
jgi:hypothetical protein